MILNIIDLCCVVVNKNKITILMLQPTGLLPAPESYDPNNKESWDGDKMQWERNKEHGVLNNSGPPPPSQPPWDWEHHQDPAFRERPDWPSSRGGWGGGRMTSSRGRPRGSSWESEEGRKRPHTPPLDDTTAGPSTNKWTKTSPHFNENEKGRTFKIRQSA